MSDLETRLSAALHAASPPARDAVFRVEVLVRIEQARFRRRVGRTLVVVGVLAVLVALNARAIDAWMTADGERLWIVALATAATLWGIPLTMIGPGFRTAARAVGRASGGLGPLLTYWWNACTVALL